MRKALFYNFLLEATFIASIAIVIMLVVRKVFRKQLGNRTIMLAWLLVAIRLLCPLSLPNPLINEIRSPYAQDNAIRPIAGQVQVRVKDLVSDLDRLQYRLDLDKENIMVKSIHSLENAIYDGSFAEIAFWVYITGAAGTAAWFVFRNIRFRSALRAGRVEALSGKTEAEYHELCVRLNINRLPVYYTDPLPSACLVGVFRPYIALPLTSKPSETILVLEHEICHYKGWDHVWGILRLFCCIVHWFNPLVWLAASLSMNDSELACDERVIKDFNDEERREYAGILVLAAARKNAPGLPVLATGMTMTGKKLKERVRSIISQSKARRWLSIGFSALACILLVFAFATSEHIPSVRFSVAAVASTDAYAKVNIADGETAVKQAQNLWQSPFFAGNSNSCEWSADKQLNGYAVTAYSESGIRIAEMTLLPDSTVAHYYNALESPWQESSVVEGAVPSKSWDELATYLLGFMDAVLPGHSATVEAFAQGKVIEKQAARYATMTGLVHTPVGIEPGYSFCVKVTGSVPQIVSFNMEQPVFARLWLEGMSDYSSPDASRMNGLLARAYTETDKVGRIGIPAESELNAEDALKIAMDAICDVYGETPDSLRRFEVCYMYTDEETPHLWRFDFKYKGLPDMYFVNIDASSGEICKLSGRDEGNG